MYIFHLFRQEPIAHEENSALVLIAETELQARIRAAQLCGVEGETAWLERATVQVLGSTDIHTEIVVADLDTFACIDCLEA